jgi:hypothetical protein
MALVTIVDVLPEAQPPNDQQSQHSNGEKGGPTYQYSHSVFPKQLRVHLPFHEYADAPALQSSNVALDAVNWP